MATCFFIRLASPFRTRDKVDMRTYSTNAKLKSALGAFRNKGLSIGFVPTMGNLHQGHIDLVRKAQRLCDVVVVVVAMLFVRRRAICHDARGGYLC